MKNNFSQRKCTVDRYMADFILNVKSSETLAMYRFIGFQQIYNCFH